MVSFRVILGFGLVRTPLDKNIIGSFFWSYPLLFSTLRIRVAQPPPQANRPRGRD